MSERNPLATCVRSLSLLATLSAAVLVSTLSGSAEVFAVPPSTEQPPAHFERDVLPILAQNCHLCHGAETQESQLDLRTVTSMLRGGETGPAIVRGDSETSLLIDLLARGQMPPGNKKKLSPDQIALIRGWIKADAPADEKVVELPARTLVSDEDRQFWAFQKPLKREPPNVTHADRVRSPIDAFVLARLEEKGLTLSPDADRVTLLRRAYFDLIGLPPTPQEADEFLNDQRPDAYEQLLDRLLTSAHYGERWGRHWLDAAGYVDTRLFDGDLGTIYVNEGIWRYRDYVVRSVNADKPCDRFLTEQLAGDELVDFMEHGWSLKRLHKQIMSSTVYLQSSRRPAVEPQLARATASGGRQPPDPIADEPNLGADAPRSPIPEQIDPENRLLWRMNLRRSEAEIIRDAVLRDPAGYNTSGKMVWSSGWLPAIYQGTEFSSRDNAVHHLKPPRPLPLGAQPRSLRLLGELNEEHRQNHPRESELEARIQNFELAARMQLAAGDIVDVSRESKATRDLYGLDNPQTAGYGMRCLMARRLVESGVRFVQVFPPLNPSFQPWDSHSNLKGGLETICSQVDQPSAALVKDLKQRGLLDEVIVMLTGEFGRLPITEGADGRDHNRNAFSLFLAGGGFKAALVWGASDEFGYAAIENRVSVPDLHATILHLLGLDHTKLTYPYSGRPERLTDPEVTKARVVGELLNTGSNEAAS